MIKPDYDIFISYRRGSGLYLAKNIATSLQSFGYKVFFDYDSMHNDEFDTQIYKAIESSKDFILVLTEGALDRCYLDNDWVKREILCAKSHNKNIILATDDERFKDYPDNLPASLDFLKKIDWTPIHPKLFEGSLKLLCKRLTSHRKSIKYIIGSLAILAVMAISLLLYIVYPSKTIRFYIDEDEEYPLELPKKYNQEIDPDDLEDIFPYNTDIFIAYSSSENSNHYLILYVEDFDELSSDEQNVSEEKLEVYIDLLKGYSIQEYVKAVQKNAYNGDKEIIHGIEPLYFKTDIFEWGLFSLISNNENLEIWRCAAKYSDVIYANITIITKKMNFIEHQRMIYNIKRSLKKNDNTIKRYIDEEYT